MADLLKRVRLYVGGNQQLYLLIDGETIPLPMNVTNTLGASGVIDGNDSSYIFDGGIF